MIFAYTHQWGDNPVDEKGLIFLALLWAVVLIFLGRFKVIINDEFVMFRTDVWIPVKIPTIQIKNVSLIKGGYFDTVKTRYFYDYFAKYTICIQLKSGKAYHITIREAERIKEEIEKRMLKQNSI